MLFLRFSEKPSECSAKHSTVNDTQYSSKPPRSILSPNYRQRRDSFEIAVEAHHRDTCEVNSELELSAKQDDSVFCIKDSSVVDLLSEDSGSGGSTSLVISEDINSLDDSEITEDINLISSSDLENIQSNSHSNQHAPLYMCLKDTERNQYYYIKTIKSGENTANSVQVKSYVLIRDYSAERAKQNRQKFEKYSKFLQQKYFNTHESLRLHHQKRLDILYS